MPARSTSWAGSAWRYPNVAICTQGRLLLNFLHQQVNLSFAQPLGRQCTEFLRTVRGAPVSLRIRFVQVPELPHQRIPAVDLVAEDPRFLAGGQLGRVAGKRLGFLRIPAADDVADRFN